MNDIVSTMFIFTIVTIRWCTMALSWRQQYKVFSKNKRLYTLKHPLRVLSKLSGRMAALVVTGKGRNEGPQEMLLWRPSPWPGRWEARAEGGMGGLEDTETGAGKQPGHSSPTSVCSVQGWAPGMGFSCGPGRGRVGPMPGGVFSSRALSQSLSWSHLLTPPCPRGTADASASESDSWGPNLIFEHSCKKWGWLGAGLNKCELNEGSCGQRFSLILDLSGIIYVWLNMPDPTP